MLSRIAESLFWIGRYVERAEDTARILDVHIHHLLEAPVASEAQLCQSLLAIMGLANRRSDDEADGYRADSSLVNARAVTHILAFDPSNPSSIVSSLQAARANARGVSEAISSEMWEALNVTYNALPGQIEAGRRVAPYAFFRFVRERAAIFAGLTESTMSRDDAWRFLVLGRSLERVDMLARLLSTAAPGADTGPDWVVLLRSCSAHEAFLRTYRREPEPTLAAEFLLLDRLFPRSVFCALSTAEECLAELDPRAGRAGMPDEARRILGHLRTNLEFRRIDDLLQDLPGLLNSVQMGCGSASAALASRYFRQTSPIEWIPEGAGLEAASSGSARP
ncbi:MAG TPA: alpha-E domain-containing protein [Acidimicrobiales bacterium]|nr:alpha-E domain-containing protein [Acidimicrobiales bacterium]